MIFNTKLWQNLHRWSSHNIMFVLMLLITIISISDTVKMNIKYHILLSKILRNIA